MTNAKYNLILILIYKPYFT